MDKPCGGVCSWFFVPQVTNQPRMNRDDFNSRPATKRARCVSSERGDCMENERHRKDKERRDKSSSFCRLSLTFFDFLVGQIFRKRQEILMSENREILLKHARTHGISIFQINFTKRIYEVKAL